MKKYFKIGEISKLYGIGVDSIRYYENIGLIHPTRSESGYRHYSIHDIWRMNVIRDLRSLGMSMEQIQEYLNHHTVHSSLSMLEYEQETIKKQMEQLQRLQKNVEQRLRNLHSATALPFEEIQMISLPDRRCHHLLEGYKYDDEMDVLMKQLINLNHNQLHIIGNNQMGTVVSLTSVPGHPPKLNYESVFLIDDEGDDLLPGGTYLSVAYRGSYHQSISWGEQLLQYAKEKRYEILGDFLEILWVDIHTTSEESEFITELQLPVNILHP